jgi:DNA-binding transcriptional MerR regulator
MPYFKQHLMERSGLPDRTIRNYIARGLIPKPRGHGLAAEYDDEHMVRAVGIGRMRERGMNIEEITVHTEGWTTAKWKRWVRDTEPQPPPPPPAPVPPPAASAESHGAGAEARAASAETDGEPVLPGARAHARLGDGGERYEPIEQADGEILPDGASWRMYPLITGILLMVDADAPPVVHRIAAEMIARYGAAAAAARPRSRR